MGNLCCPQSGKGDVAKGHNSISRNREQRLANYAATGIVPLRDARMQEVPGFVAELGAKVKTLDLTNNSIMELPATIEANYNLTRLTVSKNLLTGLPPQISLLSNLKFLTVDDNKLLELPHAICGLERLEYLSASGNELTVLPEELGQLSRLKTLLLSRNRLQQLPDSLGRCSDLEELAAADNVLTSIPASFSDLGRLKVCNLDGNRIEAVPPEVLLRCSALQQLSLHNNPITAASLEATEGYPEFEQRRRTKFDKQIAAGVLIGPKGLDDGVDRNATRQ